MLDGGSVCEDVTSITLPTVEHPTTTISASGMAMDVDMPNTTHLNAMELSIAPQQRRELPISGYAGQAQH